MDLLVALPFLCCAGASAGGVAVLLLFDLVILISSGVGIFLRCVVGCMSRGVYRLLLDLVILTSSGVGVILQRVVGCMSGGVYRLLLDLVILTSSGVGIFLLCVAGCMSSGVYRAAPTCLPNPLSGRNHPSPIFFISVLQSDSSVLLLPLGRLFRLDGAGLSTSEGVFHLDAAFLSSGGVFHLDAAACCFLSHHTLYAQSLEEEEEEDSKPEEDIPSLYESLPASSVKLRGLSCLPDPEVVE